MERLRIDEVIAHCKRHTERMENHSGRMQLEETPIGNSNIMKQYWEHRKVAEWLEELKRYKDAEENGMLKMLPCRVGDTVYCLTSARTKFVECEVLWIEIHQNGVIVFSIDGGLGDVVLAHLGKTWFLTMEAAEQALAKMKGEN